MPVQWIVIGLLILVLAAIPVAAVLGILAFVLDEFSVFDGRLRLGIGEKLFQRADSLSGGEKQRVAVARALYQGAGAQLADEPLAALDPARARETIALLVDVAREQGMTLVVSMHEGDRHPDHAATAALVELTRAFLRRHLR